MPNDLDLAEEEQIVFKWLNTEEPRIVHIEERDYWRDKTYTLEAIIEAARDEMGTSTLSYHILSGAFK